MEFLNYVNGEFAPSSSKNTLPKISPFDGSVLGQMAMSDPMDLVLSLQSSKKALTALEKVSVQERSRLLHRIADELEKRAEEISFQEALHQGLPKKFVRENSVNVAISLFRKNANDILTSTSEGSLSADQIAVTQTSAVGIIGIVAAWPLSLRVISERLAPALAAGNVVILKASEQSPITAKILGEVFTAVQMPAGLVNILLGGADLAQALAGHPSVHALSAVGRASTAESLIKAASARFKKIQISSGVKNPTLVLGDADFKALMPEILRPFLLGQGQMGWNTSRIFVLESVHKEFLEALNGYLDTLKPLESPEGDSVWTPMISDASRKQIYEKIQFAVGEHGKVVWGGSELDRSGFFYRPTVMLDLPNCSTLQQDEIHGPLLLVTPVKYQHEMLKWANTSYLSHSAVIWGSLQKAMKVAAKLEGGHVWLNSWMKNGQEGVIEGHKQSSFGIQDFNWNGRFYSDVKKMTGSL